MVVILVRVGGIEAGVFVHVEGQGSRVSSFFLGFSNSEKLPQKRQKSGQRAV